MTFSHLQMADTSITLTDGRWEGVPLVPGGASRPRIELIKELKVDGDIDGDGALDAVVLLSEASGGTGNLLSLALVTREKARLINKTTLSIGDRVQIRNAYLQNGRIVLELVQAGKADAMCCPGDLVTRSWVWKNGQLSELPPQIEGRLRLEIVGEEEWKLVGWDLHEAKTDTLPVTLAFTQGQFAGSAGCNRYFAKVEEQSTPGEISVGPVGATRKLCSPEEMKTEDRFLSVLPHVRSYRFWNSRLALVYVEKETTRTLLFRR